MKTAALMHALDLAKSSLGPADSALPIVGHFCFTDGTLYAYDDVTAIVVDLDSDLSCGLHGETLLAMVPVIGMEDIQLEHSNHSVKFKVANGYMEVPKMHAKDFIFEMPADLKSRASIPISADFLNALELCLSSCDDLNLNAAFAGVTLAASKDGITLYATDNETAIRCEIDGEVAAKISVILPVRACAQLLKLPGKDTVLELGSDLATVDFGGGLFVTKVLPADPKIFEDVFEKSFDDLADNLEPIPKGMAKEIVKAAVVLGKEREKYCMIEFTKDSMRVNAAGVLGKMETVSKINCSYPGSVLVMTDPMLKILPYVNHFFVNDGESIIFANPDTGLVRMIASRPIQKEKPKPARKTKIESSVDDDDIPF